VVGDRGRLTDDLGRGIAHTLFFGVFSLVGFGCFVAGLVFGLGLLGLLVLLAGTDTKGGADGERGGAKREPTGGAGVQRTWMFHGDLHGERGGARLSGAVPRGTF